MKLFLLGGFLGSGKTTAIQQACLQLMDKGIRVGVITNDQGVKIVDSAFIIGFHIPGREVVNGCFCCNYSQLERGIQSLEKENSPEIIFAESVGSCTDVIATVIKPLLRFRPDLKVALSVFADAVIVLKMLQGIPFSFDDDVNYIYEKQLEEADVLVINKKDLLTSQQQQVIMKEAKGRFPGKEIIYQNSLQPEDISKWLQALQDFDFEKQRYSLEINYDKYGAGEAKLAWLDDEIDILSAKENAIEMGTILINRIYEKIQQEKYPIGHLKFLMQARDWQRKISFTSLDEPKVKQTHSLLQPHQITLLINARIQTDPDKLEKILLDAMQVLPAGCHAFSKSLSVFQPGYPKPEHRMEH